MVKIVTSTFLKDAVIKSVLNEYDVKSQELSEEDMNYGDEAIEPPFNPFQLEKLRDISGLHDICITVKCEDAIYSGKKIISKEGMEIPVELEEFLNDFQFDEECESFLNDLETYGFAGLEILREGSVFKSVNHIPSLYLRMCRDKKRVVQKIGNQKSYFKLYDPMNAQRLNKSTGVFEEEINRDAIANELLWFNGKSNESKVYGKPKYLSELDAILTDNAIIEYQQGHFKAKGIPNYVITVTGSIEEKDDYSMDDFERDLETEFSTVTNEPGTALVMCVPSDGDAPINVNVHKIGEEKKEGSFLALAESVADRIYRIHRVPRERLGESKSSGIASNRTEMLLKNYSKSTVGNAQKRMANYINKTIIKYEFSTNDHKIEYLPCNFDEEDKVLDRGIKLLQNGAMRLGEFINRFGESFELHMDESDEYYNARFMNNQSLDSVLYGDDPVDAEGKLNSLIADLDEDLKA
ncbi:phage capsid protein [Methanobrevibacter sp.]|uniref:phage capsid protein n=1 Tax=Methanobrevibacter sp. TaxID=66852 RepID=UPI0026E10D47|nr:phage capsid protein [Methanobrevibacter sp.]MDO5824667.1 phage capsid protein [Methanobrevibacter sp.]